MHDDLTLVITSCNRLDLLHRTLRTMRPWIEEIPHRIIVEDSDADPGLFDPFRDQGFKVLVNGRNLGQLPSIDRAYAECRTEFILHCEDDWEFTRRPNIEAARHLLRHGMEGEGEFSLVCFRELTGTRRLDQSLFRDVVVRGSAFRYSFTQRNKWGYFSFNPGMIRREFWLRHGPWRHFTNERAIARAMRRKGHCIARELPGNVRHIGKGRSRVRARRFRWIRDSTRKWFGPGGILGGR